MVDILRSGASLRDASKDEGTSEVVGVNARHIGWATGKISLGRDWLLPDEPFAAARHSADLEGS